MGGAGEGRDGPREPGDWAPRGGGTSGAGLGPVRRHPRPSWRPASWCRVGGPPGGAEEELAPPVRSRCVASSG